MRVLSTLSSPRCDQKSQKTSVRSPSLGQTNRFLIKSCFKYSQKDKKSLDYDKALEKLNEIKSV
jgi:hypothetical protein